MGSGVSALISVEFHWKEVLVPCWDKYYILGRPVERSMWRVIVVTGANKGIDFHIARLLAESKSPSDVVYLTSRDETRGREAVDVLKKHPSNTIVGVKRNGCCLYVRVFFATANPL